MSRHISVDIGGSAARCYLGEFDGEKLAITELHTFRNDPIMVAGKWHWNAHGLFEGIIQALRIARDRCGDTIDSLAIDCMGNAFGLLDKEGALLEQPAYTRAPQSEAIMARLYQHIDRDVLYPIVGLEQSKINSVYYLLEYQTDAPAMLAKARRFLMLPDLLGYWLSGEMASEYCISSTSYLMDAAKRDWSWPLIETLGLDARMFGPITPPGTIVGKLRPALADETGLHKLRVIQAPSHDTSSAIVCIENAIEKSRFGSSGTWGMLGCKLDQPLLTPEAMRANFANEGAAFGQIKFTHNTPSLCILQQCMDEWTRSGMAVGWNELYAEAEQSRPFLALLDLGDPVLRSGGQVVESIQECCRKSGQPLPRQRGEIARIVLEGSILNYLYAMDHLGMLTRTKFSRVTLVGGGARIPFLRHGIATALGKQVRIGPAESTTLGNLVVQMLATGTIGSINDGWEATKHFYQGHEQPDQDKSAWMDAYARFDTLLQHKEWR